MKKEFENRLKQVVKPILESGRGGDWHHTLRAVDFARHLLKSEDGEEDIVIPALYLHDIGWSRIDYSDFQNAPPAQKKDAKSVGLHMQIGAEMAAEILTELEWDPDKIRRIASIIEVHDEPDKAFGMNDPSAVLVVEADRLDRYGPDSLDRYRKMFGKKALNGSGLRDARQLRLTGLKAWFKTLTAKELAKKMGEETGWFGG